MKRNNFIKTLSLSPLALSLSPAENKNYSTLEADDFKLQIGLASYTLRKYSLDELIEIVLRLDIKNVCLKSFHLPYEATDEQLQYTADKLKARGINLYAGGVIYFKTEEDINKYFKYAKAAGLKMIIGAPEHQLLPLIEQKVKETNIKLAIHNHGPEDKIFPSPQSIYDKIKNLDSRIGLCIDTGHTFRLNQDPATEIKKYKDRLFDLHIKDLLEQTTVAKDVEMGRGKMDIPSIVKALKEIKYTGFLGVEYEKDAEHAVYGLSESVGYLRGIMRMA
jgi:inosose dehydratase